MASPAEIDDLHSALKNRIEKRKLSHPEECRRAAAEKAEHAEAASSALYYLLFYIQR